MRQSIEKPEPSHGPALVVGLEVVVLVLIQHCLLVPLTVLAPDPVSAVDTHATIFDTICNKDSASRVASAADFDRGRAGSSRSRR